MTDIRASELQRLVGDGRLARFAYWSLIVYFTIYTFESPIRYVLSAAHADTAILARDALIWLPMLSLGFTQLMRRKLHPAYTVCGLFLTIGFIVSLLNFGLPMPPLIGTKMLVNTILGLVIGAFFILPTKATARYMLFLFVATVVGVVLEKYIFKFPWVGVHAVIAGKEVEISRDWQTADPNAQRIGGFTKESISAAILVGQFGLVCAFQFRSFLIRGAILAMAIGTMYLTTQKGAILGMILVSGAALAPPKMRAPLLRAMAVFALVMVVTLPLLTIDLRMPYGAGGVFSTQSFAERVDDTWPKSLAWVWDHGLFPFGNGTGGIGQAQALMGVEAQHFPDNMFLFLYAFFGESCAILFGWILYGVFRSARIDPDIAGPALAVITFNLFYGIVVSVLEDQVAALFVGASVGVLLCATAARRKRLSARPITPARAGVRRLAYQPRVAGRAKGPEAT